jgi:hypothetical protein
MNKGAVRQWCRMFTMKREMVGRPSVVSDDLVQNVDQEVCERQHFTNSELLCEFT